MKTSSKTILNFHSISLRRKQELWPLLITALYYPYKALCIKQIMVQCLKHLTDACIMLLHKSASKFKAEALLSFVSTVIRPNFIPCWASRSWSLVKRLDNFFRVFSKMRLLLLFWGVRGYIKRNKLTEIAKPVMTRKQTGRRGSSGRQRSQGNNENLMDQLKQSQHSAELELRLR